MRLPAQRKHPPRRFYARPDVAYVPFHDAPLLQWGAGMADGPGTRLRRRRGAWRLSLDGVQRRSARSAWTPPVAEPGALTVGSCPTRPG